MRNLLKYGSALCFAAMLSAQSGAAVNILRAMGEGVVSTKPDQARISIAVVTQAATAQEASQQNATQTTTVLGALQTAAGPGAEIRTTSYAVTPNYSNPRPGEQSVLIGFTVTNQVEVTLADLTIIGKVIDAAILAGANRVTSLSFGLKDDQRQRLQALRLAAVQAKAHADAMAAGVNLRSGAILSIQEGSVGIIQPLRTTLAGAVTPIETGLVEVRASVTMEVELLR